MMHLDTIKTGITVPASWLMAVLSWEVAGSIMGLLVGMSSLVLSVCWIVYVRKKTYYLDKNNGKELEE